MIKKANKPSLILRLQIMLLAIIFIPFAMAVPAFAESESSASETSAASETVSDDSSTSSTSSADDSSTDESSSSTESTDSSSTDTEEDDSDDDGITIAGIHFSVVAIIIIAAALVLVIALVVVIILKKKKKKSPVITPVQDTDQYSVTLPDENSQITAGPIPNTVPVPVAVPSQNQNIGWFIRIIGGTMNNFVYPVGNGIMIGRSAECNVRYPIDAGGISRKHCRIYSNGNDIYVVDLGSTAGTFLRNGAKLTPNIPQPVHTGDTIYLGEQKNLIEIIYNQ